MSWHMSLQHVFKLVRICHHNMSWLYHHMSWRVSLMCVIRSSGGIIFLHVTGFFLHVNKCRSHAVHMRTVRFVSIAFVCDVACERAKISHVIICVFACERQYFTQEPQFSHAKIFCISHAFRVCVACVI